MYGPTELLQLIDQVRGAAPAGRRRAIARLITRIENDEEVAREAIKALYADTGRAHIVGITGPPGSGKSTLVNEVARAIRQQHSLLVGIVAVDPSSPFTGGALLGDRVRMRDLAGDEGIFIRSMASRGSLGGLARTTGHVIKILDAAGFDVILIETVGAGQAEVDVASTAHTTIVIEAPGMGDDIQSIKAGILEIADILVVNKADRPGADSAVKALKLMLHMGASHPNADGASSAWEAPVLETVATEGKGIPAVVEMMMAHRRYLRESGAWLAREKARSRREVGQLLQARFMAQLQAAVPQQERDAMIEAVARREIDPYSAIERLFEQITI
ncbi:MAG: methylmalonyl Co-A mutase-associated GTPase MeaB [Chloroflexi bacterium]|nr:methylmalonyl Co-A mutase-associated GTPase MeaB [Chloroflexota bacterium]MCI0579105.1 methylmalonyl Co-A mutase-associated GTPase MeaB [Chloroflexota bacterium]MCI0650072.1 methylmalonyl Co-A mutase-associated GTPase MeaB [Chloroflexota bacterium]MCI0728301.1 methylmalonyl Co-A mutase-associated GTPase MeaB [Chloroflexota bacterium]